MRAAWLPTLAAVLALTGAARAEVVDAQSNGFEVTQTADIAAPMAKVWKALGHIDAWWNPNHTFTGSAKNLTIDLSVGGCFCETLPLGGSSNHLTVIFVRPGQLVRFSGALGPLQSMGVIGHLTWTMTEKDGHTAFTQTYDVGGYVKGGAAQLAAPVDGVLGEQLARLKKYVETGAPA
jgi:uncharacterized protein YndB with AHSA1/START domain